MAAAITATPELELDPAEAKNLAEAAQAVSDHYPLVVNPTTVAWVNLAMVVGTVYGTRFIAVRNRWKQEVKKKPIIISGGQVPPHGKPNGVAYGAAPTQNSKLDKNGLPMWTTEPAE